MPGLPISGSIGSMVFWLHSNPSRGSAVPHRSVKAQLGLVKTSEENWVSEEVAVPRLFPLRVGILSF